jgi:hypothetical protein
MRLRTKRIRLILEELESRLVPTNVTVPLDPTLNQFGEQVATVQAYGDTTRAAFGIFDTGATAITFAANDQALFTAEGNPIPIKVPGGAHAGGIGGAIVGDVSQPGTILADGMHAMAVNFDSWGLPNFQVNLDATSAATPGIQAFVGTPDGSPDLPTITGTPIFNASPSHPNGVAARIDMQGESLDFSSLVPGLVLTMPDLHFVDPGTQLQGGTGITDPVYIPLGSFGSDNHNNPGNAITESPSPMQNNVSLYYTPQVGMPNEADNGHFLLDTGSQLTVISTDLANALGLDLNHPDTTITVQGVGGSMDVPGFTLNKLELPTTDPNTFVDFTNVPVYVLDVAPGVDGLLGTNLWDTANQLLYDPNNPSGATLGVTFYANPERGTGPGAGQLNDLNTMGLSFFSGVVSGHAIPGFTLPNPIPPTASWDTVSPGLRNTPIGSENLTFSRPVFGVGLSDLHLTRDGTEVSLAGASLTTSDHIHYTLGNLAGLDGAQGHYTLTLRAAGSGIHDATGSALLTDASQGWAVDTTQPTVVISTPSNAYANSSRTITYTVSYTDDDFLTSTLGPADVTLNATGTATGNVSVSGTGTMRIVTISGITGDGTLGISLAPGTAVDAAGNLAGGAGPSATFVVDNTAPSASILPVTPASRTAPVSTISITFSEPVTGFGLAGFTLTRGGQFLPLTGATLAFIDGQHYLLTLPFGVTVPGGDYRLTLSARASGAHDWAGNPQAADASVTWHQVLFSDNFSRPNNSTLGPNWVRNSGNLAIAHQQLQVTTGTAVATVNQLLLANADVQAQVNVTGPGSRSAGVVARYINEQNYYWATLVAVNGHYTAEIWRNVNGRWLRLSSRAVSTGAGTLDFQVVGNSLKLFLNGTLVGSAQDSSLTRAGAVGVRGTSLMALGAFIADRL